jgi:phosphoribosylformylglycinamidine synthase
MVYTAEIKVMPLKELLDPQGKATLNGLKNLGQKEITDVRIGKQIHLKIEADSKEQAEAIAKTACQKLLANPVMEYFELMIHE